MIYIFTALYCEAQIFIRRFHLIKNQETAWFQEFYNEAAGIRLAVTGAGELAAAAVVGSVCSMHRPSGGDLLLNVGICAHTAKKDGLFLCNQITEMTTGKTFYPDMLCRHTFCEGSIVTGMVPWNNTGHGSNTPSLISGRILPAMIPDGDLYDMEAAAVYQTGIHFFGPHQMTFLKIVSDNGAASEVSAEQTAFLVEQYFEQIAGYITELAAFMEENNRRSCLCPETEQLVETFCADLHCSRAMRDSMRQYIRYLSLAKIDYIPVIQDFYARKLLPCRDKREGKKYFEEFRQRLF